jgi:hypothetical protein
MPTRIEGHSETTSWNEEPYFANANESKLTSASVKAALSGGITGESNARYLQVYVSEKAGKFVGVERFAGKVEGRKGSFVVQIEGTFAPEAIRAQWAVVPGSGREELTNLQGSGTYFWEPKLGHRTLFTFEYELGT